MTMLAVLTTGLLLVGPAALILGDWRLVTWPGLSLAALSGATYTLAAFGLYRAFSIGPVRLVSPVIGAFPILSLLVAAAQGRYPTLGQWLAVFAIVLGVAMIAVLTDHHDHPADSDAARDGAQQYKAEFEWSPVARWRTELLAEFERVYVEKA